MCVEREVALAFLSVAVAAAAHSHLHLGLATSCKPPLPTRCHTILMHD
jgi:hypothetical protein